MSGSNLHSFIYPCIYHYHIYTSLIRIYTYHIQIYSTELVSTVAISRLWYTWPIRSKKLVFFSTVFLSCFLKLYFSVVFLNCISVFLNRISQVVRFSRLLHLTDIFLKEYFSLGFFSPYTCLAGPFINFLRLVYLIQYFGFIQLQQIVFI